MARLLAVIPADSPTGLRLRALVLAYLLTGRRRSEVLNLRWRDVDLEAGFYRYTSQGGNERRRALPPPVQQAILAYAEAAGLARKPDEAVFPGRWRDQPVDGKCIGEQLRQAERDDHATGRPSVYWPTPKLLQLLGAETLEEARGRVQGASQVPSPAEPTSEIETASIPGPE